MTHVISFMLILQSNEIILTNFFASSPTDSKAAPKAVHKKIKPNRFRFLRRPGDVLKLFKYPFVTLTNSLLGTISNNVSYSLKEISTILSGNKFLFEN